MKYVRPYGRSEVPASDEKDINQDKNRKRVLLPNEGKEGEKPKTFNFSEFYNQTPEFIIAQYISVIDKIFNKPQEKIKLNLQLIEFRKNLTKAAQKHLGKTEQEWEQSKKEDNRSSNKKMHYPSQIEGDLYQSLIALKDKNEEGVGWCFDYEKIVLNIAAYHSKFPNNKKNRNRNQKNSDKNQGEIQQWNDTIDKIFNKPKTKPDTEQKNYEELKKYRTELGKIAWKHLQEKYKIPNFYKALWDWKIEATRKKYVGIEGHWYKRFSPYMPARLKQEFYQEIVQRIETHISEKALRLHRLPQKGCGLIERQTLAITNNILKERKFLSANYNKEDFKEYEGVISHIYQEILKTFNNSGTGDKRRPLPSEEPYHIAIKLLKEFLEKKLYPEKKAYQEELRLIKEKKEPSLKFKFYQDVCALYKKLLKDSNANGAFLREKIERNLPKNYRELFSLLTHQNQNKDVNHLIRLGKIIHYEAAEKASQDVKKLRHEDSTAFILRYFPNEDEVKNSAYWGSNKQTFIKQNEAFVRIFRTVISFAARTFDDWVDPENKIKGKDGHQKDILMQRKEAYANFKTEDFNQKAEALFGKSLKIENETQDEDKKELIQFTGDYLYNLRNGSFHFKGLLKLMDLLTRSSSLTDSGRFKESKPLTEKKNNKAFEIIKNLYENDFANRDKALKKILNGFHFMEFFEDIENNFCNLILQAEPSLLTLPNLKNLLERVKHAWSSEEKIQLPPCPDIWEAQTKEQKWKICQYNFLKLLYERPFKNWLEYSTKKKISDFRDKVVERSQKGTERLNPEKKFIYARAKEIDCSKLNEKHVLQSFLSELTAKTASEMRIQKGYNSNPEQARKQAHYIENFKKDVIAKAFEEYLKNLLKEDFEKVVGDIPSGQLSFQIQQPVKKTDQQPEEKLEEQDSKIDPKHWMPPFYFFLHLIPAQISNDLYHQLLKWSVVTEKNERQTRNEKDLLQKLLSLFILYHDMSSAQFENIRKEKETLKPLAGYFENQSLFDSIFQLSDTESDELKPLPLMKGIREMLRFGRDYTLPLIFEKETHKITQDQFKEWQDLKTDIEAKQKKRKELHEKWKKDQNDGSRFDKKDAYKKNQIAVERYGHLNAHIMLQNHVRLFHLTIRVLGRLLDYSGLWERNLYFTSLALIYKCGIPMAELAQLRHLKDSFKGKLENGEIAAALAILERSYFTYPLSQTFLSSLKKNMDLPKRDFLEKSDNIKLRNNFAHFAMLHEGVEFNLTKEVNKARQLMAHDRKLKNAVSQSIKELLEREGLMLKWEMDNQHNLHVKDKAKDIFAKKIYHLGTKNIYEESHGDEYLKMVREIF